MGNQESTDRVGLSDVTGEGERRERRRVTSAPGAPRTAETATGKCDGIGPTRVPVYGGFSGNVRFRKNLPFNIHTLDVVFAAIVAVHAQQDVHALSDL